MEAPLAPPPSSQRFIHIDEDGYFKMEELRVADVETGHAWLSQLQFDPLTATATTRMEKQDVIVESFDAPYIVLRAEKSGTQWSAQMPYGYRENFLLETLTLDEWDRFHGRTERGIPFVFSRSAQSAFFDQLEDFDDDSITDAGARYEMRPWLKATADEVSEPSFWTERYASGETPWDKNYSHPLLPKLVAQLKLLRSRILVAGCGRGHDAAWLAQAGHIVTAVDYSEEAIKQAKELYGHISGLTFVQADVFNLPKKFDQAFDIVFEHTLYCAVDPQRRSELVRAWRRVLIDNGHIFALMFVAEKSKGPPYGGSEWEVRARLAKNFRPLYWQRLRDSVPARLGTELFLYSQKLPALR